jgi:hypothetical protein
MVRLAKIACRTVVLATRYLEREDKLAKAVRPEKPRGICARVGSTFLILSAINVGVGKTIERRTRISRPVVVSKDAALQERGIGAEIPFYPRHQLPTPPRISQDPPHASR